MRHAQRLFVKGAQKNSFTISFLPEFLIPSVLWSDVYGGAAVAWTQFQDSLHYIFGIITWSNRTRKDYIYYTVIHLIQFFIECGGALVTNREGGPSYSNQQGNNNHAVVFEFTIYCPHIELRPTGMWFFCTMSKGGHLPLCALIDI